jgi:hypothetical protein
VAASSTGCDAGCDAWRLRLGLVQALTASSATALLTFMPAALLDPFFRNRVENRSAMQLPSVERIPTSIQAVIQCCNSRKMQVTFGAGQFLAVLQVGFTDGHQLLSPELRQRHPPVGRELHGEKHVIPQNPSTPTRMGSIKSNEELTRRARARSWRRGR